MFPSREAPVSGRGSTGPFGLHEAMATAATARAARATLRIGRTPLECLDWEANRRVGGPAGPVGPAEPGGWSLERRHLTPVRRDRRAPRGQVNGRGDVA